MRPISAFFTAALNTCAQASVPLRGTLCNLTNISVVFSTFLNFQLDLVNVAVFRNERMQDLSVMSWVVRAIQCSSDVHAGSHAFVVQLLARGLEQAEQYVFIFTALELLSLKLGTHFRDHVLEHVDNLLL